MIDVEDLRTLIRHDQQTLLDIERIFRALVDYPDGEEIHNATRADLTGAFAAACESLIGDGNNLPADTAAQITSRLAGTATIGAPTYGGAVAALRDNPDPFVAALVS